jgi:hypothetical protein
MTNAWEVTKEDVLIVLSRHNKAKSVDDAIVGQAYDMLDCDMVEDAALTYIGVEKQQASALAEIEDQLMEDGFVPVNATKQFEYP